MPSILVLGSHDLDYDRLSAQRFGGNLHHIFGSYCRVAGEHDVQWLIAAAVQPSLPHGEETIGRFFVREDKAA